MLDEEKKKATRAFLNEARPRGDRGRPAHVLGDLLVGARRQQRWEEARGRRWCSSGTKGKSLTPQMVVQACLRCRDTEVLIFIFIGAPAEELVRVLVKEQVDFSALSAAQREYVEDRIISSESARHQGPREV